MPDYLGWQQAPDLDNLLDCLKQNKSYDNQAKRCSSTALYPGEPTGIPRLEGYEWGVLQEYNIYKTGALVRIAGACDFAKKKDETESKFVAPEINEDLDPNHPDRAFDDTYAFNSQCKSQLRTIAKSAIRTVLARLVADQRGNALVLGSRLITPTAGGPAQAVPVSRAAVQTGKFCLTELGPNGNSNAPPTDAEEYVDKPCDGFEEFVASMAIESVRRGVPVFEPADLPMIWTFWCIKVWDGCTVNGKAAVPITNEEQAVTFIENAIAFIERVQQETEPIYAQTTVSETIVVTQLMASLPQTMTTYPFIKDICRACIELTGLPFAENSSRADLRACNLKSVMGKINGKHANVIDTLDGQYLLFPDKSTLNKLKSDLGVKNYALYNLRVRASNISANDLYSVTVALYAGDGKDVATYERMTEYDLPYFPAGGRTLVDVKPVPKSPSAPKTPPPVPTCDRIELQESESYTGTPKPTSDVNLFPALFIITNTVEELGSGPESYRGISFVIDPEQEYLEADKANNQADLFYYTMAGYDPQTPPEPPDSLPLLIGEVESGAICRVNTPPLDIDLTIVPGADPAAGGGQYVAVPIYSDTTLVIQVANRSNQPVRAATITLDGEEVVANITIDANGNYSHTVPFVPAEARSYQFIAQVVGSNSDGNSVGPVDASATLNATRNRKAFDITLYDASPLSKLEHPFSRWNLHHDVDTGRELPVVGAVTDGEALLRIDVAGLEPSEPVSITLKDVDVREATAGFGQLELVDAEGQVITSGLEIVVTTPADLDAGSSLRYRPPAGFVRPEYHLRDALVDARTRFPRLTRQVEVTFDQRLTGITTQRILLKRPPVFLFHGLGGDPTVWNSFHPIVPETGVNLRSTQYVKGYDGRFMVFAAGSSPTVHSVSDEAKNNYFRFRGALQNPDLKDYAVAGVDVVANSMGGLITREIARQFVELRLPVPFHKLITIGTPHAGSPVADKVDEIAEASLLSLQFDPLAVSLEDPMSSAALDLVLANRCVVALQLVGRIMPTLDLYSGAVDDLRTNSPAIQLLQAAGILIPSHYIIGQINNSNLAAHILNDGSAKPSDIFLMWTALGMLCNWTPDPTTVESTFLQRASIPAMLMVANGFGGNYVEVLHLLKDILDQQRDPPQPILPEGNDRVVPVPSQQGEMLDQARASTIVIAATDHLDIKETHVGEEQVDAVEACNQYIHAWWGTPAHEPRRSLDNKNDVPCQVVFLLESSTDSPLFCKPEETCDSGLVQAAGPAAANTADGATADQPQLRTAASSIGDSLQALASMQDVAAETAAATIADLTIVSPLPGAIVQPGQPVNVKVAVPAGVQLTELAVGLNMGMGSVDLATVSAVVTTPIEAIGPQTITALGADAAGNLYFASRSMWVNPGLLDRIVVAAPPLLAQSGQLLPVHVNGVYADGVVRDITAAAVGTAYTTTNPAVIDVTPGGWLQAKGNGAATLRVVNRSPVTGRAVVGIQRVEVQIPVGQENGIPVAVATVTPTVPTESLVYLSAADSSDPDGDPLSFRWEQTGGRLVALVDANTAQPGFIAPLVTAPEVLTFRLWVRDDRGAAALPVEVRVTVEQ